MKLQEQLEKLIFEYTNTAYFDNKIVLYQRIFEKVQE